jgi:hypothetical protein
MNSDLPTFADCFADLPDPRKAEQCDHELVGILFIAVCAVVYGGEGFTDTEEFRVAKQAWLRQFPNYPMASRRTTPSTACWLACDPKSFSVASLPGSNRSPH